MLIELTDIQKSEMLRGFFATPPEFNLYELQGCHNWYWTMFIIGCVYNTRYAGEDVYNVISYWLKVPDNITSPYTAWLDCILAAMIQYGKVQP